MNEFTAVSTQELNQIVGGSFWGDVWDGIKSVAGQVVAGIITVLATRRL
jgi:bacteriocin-like protein